MRHTAVHLPRLSRTLRAAALCVIAGLLAACSDTAPEKLLVQARDYLLKGDEEAAAIQVRNALQQDPKSGEARLLLGQLLLRQADPVSAERELRRALEFGQAPSRVVPDLARCLLEQARIDALLSEFGAKDLGDATANAELKSVLGEARLRVGRLDEARADFADALAAQPGLVAARLGVAVLAIREGRLDEAMKITEDVLAAHPGAARAHALRSDLLLAGGDVAGARNALQSAITADPRFTTARLALVSLLLRERDFAEAARQIEAGRKPSRGDARLVLLDATLSLRTGDRAAARSKVQQVLKVAPDHVPSLLLAAQIDLADGNVASAQQGLRRALNRAPGSEAVRRTLAASQLRGGQPARALETLQPLLDEARSLDPTLLLLAGEVHLANGDVRQASDYFSRAAQSDTEKAAAQTRLGQIALATGNFEAGLRQLESAASLEGDGHQADLMLIAAHLRRNAFDKADAAARALEKKAPAEPLSHYMLGVVAAARKDSAAARKHFLAAIERAPAYVPALGALASLDLAEQRPREARGHFERLIESEPANEAGYLGLAEVQARSGASPQDVADTLKRAIAAAPGSMQPRLTLVNLQLAARETDAALATASAAVAAQPQDARALEALARVQDAAGQHVQAIESLRKLAEVQPDSARPWQLKAAAQVKMRDFDRALDSLRRAQRLVPDRSAQALAISSSVAGTYLLAGRSGDALKEARSLQGKAPQSPAGHLIEGQVHASAKDWPQAERAYREALKVAPTDTTAISRLHAVLVASDKASAASSLVRGWLAKNPRDTVVRMYLAEAALRGNSLKTAFDLYAEVVGLAPDNPIALNNLAWVAGELNDPRALGWARRAVDLAPNNASVLDTLGVLLVKQGDVKQGLIHLERARSIEPTRTDLQLHYARALIAAGRKDAARKELVAIEQRPGDFAEKREAAALLQSL